MLKTIKVKKQFNLHELIKCVWDNKIKSEKGLVQYKSNLDTMVTVDMSGQIAVYGTHFGNEVFTVEVEEEITEDTRIPKTVTLTENEETCRSWNNSINGLKRAYPDALQIHAIVNGKLQLIWETE